MNEVTEAELLAYADGRLAESRRPALEAYLDEHPQARRDIEAWRAQDGALHALFDPVLAEPVPPRLLRAGHAEGLQSSRGPRRGWRQLAAGIAIGAIGAALGWTAHGLSPQPPRSRTDTGASSFAHRAAVAYAVYTPEVRHPVEVGADQSQHLVAWLSKRLATPLHVPKLRSVGFELVGGRLLPAERGPGAQLMYEDAGGRRLTLYVARDGEATAATGFRFATEGPVRTFYWIDGAYGYAISGALERGELESVARLVYDQISPP